LLSLRHVEDLLFERRIDICQDTVWLDGIVAIIMATDRALVAQEEPEYSLQVFWA
jgi:hypothetical protein